MSHGQTEHRVAPPEEFVPGCIIHLCLTSIELNEPCIHCLYIFGLLDYAPCLDVPFDQPRR